MIITREIEIVITEGSFCYYDNLGYDISIGEKIIIPVEILSKGSNYKIICQCDNCLIEKEIIYKNYLKYNIKFGDYLCRKCAEKKRKESLNKSYGVNYPIQNCEIKKKILNCRKKPKK